MNECESRQQSLAGAELTVPLSSSFLGIQFPPRTVRLSR